MNRALKRILPVLLSLIVIGSIAWYLLVYDPDFTQDVLLSGARYAERNGNHSVATWFYNLAYLQATDDDSVAIELAEQYKSVGNYTKAEVTLSNAIADGGSIDLYVALCETYVEQDKLLDAVNMLENVSDAEIKAELDAMRPETPTASPTPGFYSQYISVSVECTSGTLYVNTNGEYPSTLTDLYTGEISLSGGETTLYAIAVGDNGLVSSLAVFGYTIGGVIEDVTLADSAMDALVREILGVDETAQLRTDDLWKITELTIPESVTDYSDLALFPYLESLEMVNATFSDLQMLSSLSQLKTITIEGSVVSASDLAVIAALPNLETLTLSNCSLSNIENLSGATKLTKLVLSSNAIRDLSPLSFMTTLTELDLSHNAVTNLSALSALENLSVLDVSYNSISSAAPLSACTSLATVCIAHNTISSLEAFTDAKALVSLDASYNDLTSVDTLTGCSSLTTLNIAHNSLTDISALSALNGLQDLNFSNNAVTVIPTWDVDCDLISIDGSYNALTSVAPLSGLRSLNIVCMDYNEISNVNVLVNCSNLIQVSVYGNPVTDVSDLKNSSIIVYYDPV
ncbi:MAG: leucine-rich repeat domain-containing protein [Firmicutes bacterium]|nr:leucine-rich repeat domain-containing protein [Bacillota bacterium]